MDGNGCRASAGRGLDVDPAPGGWRRDGRSACSASSSAPGWHMNGRQGRVLGVGLGLAAWSLFAWVRFPWGGWNVGAICFTLAVLAVMAMCVVLLRDKQLRRPRKGRASLSGAARRPGINQASVPRQPRSAE